MSANSSIEWTDHTFNPWWGCTKVSPGCDHCYAERDAKRYVPSKVLWGVGSERRTFGDKHWNEPLKWNQQAIKAGRRARVFCASMADVFDNDGPASERDRLWQLIAATPALDWLLLTKRIGNAARMMPVNFGGPGFSNVWLGISVVTQEEADRDIPKLLALPARVRFLSCEPLLGAVDLNSTLGGTLWIGGQRGCGATHRGTGTQDCPREPHHHHDERCKRDIDWVIAGGESGPKARPSHPDWFRTLRDQCSAAGVAFHFKQWGEYAPNDRTFAEVEASPRKLTPVPVAGPGTVMACMDRVGKKAAGRLLDGRTWDGLPA